MDNSQVAQVELSVIISAFGQIICGKYHYWIFNNVWSEIYLCLSVILADIKHFWCHRSVNAPEISCKLGPVKHFLWGRWGKLRNIEIVRKLWMHKRFVNSNRTAMLVIKCLARCWLLLTHIKCSHLIIEIFFDFCGTILWKLWTIKMSFLEENEDEVARN